MIALNFAPDFGEPGEPDEQLSGLCCELDWRLQPRVTIGRSDKSTFTTAHSCVSRTHCTIEWFPSIKSWSLLDGGNVVEGDEQVYKPSRHGVFLNGRKIKQGDWERLEPGDKVCLAQRNTKIYVSADKDGTLTSDIWEQPGWPQFRLRGTAEEFDEDAGDVTELRASPDMATRPPVPPPSDSWGLAAQALAVFSQSPKTVGEAIWLGFLATLVAVAVVVVAIVLGS